MISRLKFQKHITCFGSDYSTHLSGIYRLEVYRQLQLMLQHYELHLPVNFKSVYA